MFDKIAEELKAARLKNNLTLKQLAAKTRIDKKFLEAMEEGNFSFLPELYVKAFIKEYATIVGLKADIVLKKYEAAKEGLPYDETGEVPGEKKVESVTEKSDEEKVSEEKPAEEKTEEKTEKPGAVKHSVHQSETVFSKPVTTFDSTAHQRSGLKTGNKSLYLIGAVIGGIIVVFGLVYLIFFNNGNEIVVPEKPYDEVVSQTRQRYEEKPTAVTDSIQNTSASSDSLNLLIQTTDTSWVKIILDDSSTEEFILFPNSQKSIKAENNFKITFGRSSAIKLHLNSKPLTFNPGSKTVTHVLINSKGLEYLYNAPTAGNE
jgi:transcriptional regulator with XRE-family HTH domain